MSYMEITAPGEATLHFGESFGNAARGGRAVEVWEHSLMLWEMEESSSTQINPNLVASLLLAQLGERAQLLQGTVVVTGDPDCWVLIHGIAMDIATALQGEHPRDELDPAWAHAICLAGVYLLYPDHAAHQAPEKDPRVRFILNDLGFGRGSDADQA